MINVSACIAGDKTTCGITVGAFLFSLTQWSEGQIINVLGYPCKATSMGRIRSWGLV
jgi:hypothetical protein